MPHPDTIQMPTMPRHGTILLIMLGLIMVMIMVAFGFVRSMQISRGTIQMQHKDELASLAADMGMSHAIAVCMQEYAMDSEKVDGATRTGTAVKTRPDGPTSNVFNIMSPRVNTQLPIQPPQAYDLAPDVPFNDLFNNFGGKYHWWTSKVSGFTSGFTMRRGYARLFEANRFDFDGSKVYDPASYDDFDPNRPPLFLKAVQPVPGGVSTPFPPVDPFLRGSYAPGRSAPVHPLDHPVWLDSEFLPVKDVNEARYRLRYAVTVTDMSAALWMNTDMPWLDDATKAKVRKSYKDSIEAVGVQLVSLNIQNGTAEIKTRYPLTLESIFLGYGTIGNSQFPDRDGKPKDWPTRTTDGFATPLATPAHMAYRSNYVFWGSDIAREFYCVLGSPYMRWFDPPGTWLGSPLASYTDLGFSVLGYGSDWPHAGEGAGARADDFAQRAGTPFGHPYESYAPPRARGEAHPWTVNVLTVPARVLQAMVSAYVPPAMRGVLISSEDHIPFYEYVDGSLNVNRNWGTAGQIRYGASTWTGNSWSISVADAVASGLSVAGSGIDLFTDSLTPYGQVPFSYPAPANRDYWGSDPAARPDPTPAADMRTNAQRYPGAAFFSRADEIEANRMTQWKNVAADPRQVESEGSGSRIPAAGVGVDHLARHIVFYIPDTPVPTPGSSRNYLTSNAGLNANWAWDFTPAMPLGSIWGPPGSCAGMSLYLPSSETLELPGAVPIAPNGEVYPNYPTDGTGPALLSAPLAARPGVQTPTGWRVIRHAGSGSTDPVTTARNSYWQRLTLAFLHAVVVAQTANLAWADPQDNRSQSIWQPIGGGFTGGPTYNTNPNSTATIVRKAPGLDPKASDFDALEQIDRQFLANLGESFEHAGAETPTVALRERPPRYLRYQCQSIPYPGPATFDIGTLTNVAEYRVTNNIRTLLTPVDGTQLTASSRDDQAPGAVPRSLWLLDEWNALNDPTYVPGTAVGTQPTALARARAKLMERTLNDWRMSFLGATREYAASFRPKDFDGDHIVFCSGYLNGSAADPDTGLSCWEPATAVGGSDGPGVSDQRPLTIFSVTGSLAFMRSHHYKIEVRGELFDNALDKAVNEKYLEAAILIDPDNNIVRGGLPSGLEDTTIMMQKPVHNYYRGYLDQSYP